MTSERLESILALLGELATAIAVGLTRRALARRLADAFGSGLPLLRLELGTCDASLTTATTEVIEVAAGQPAATVRRQLDGSAIQASVRSFRPAVVALDESARGDDAAARDRGAARAVHLPLVELEATEHGYVLLWLGAPNRQEVPLPPALLLVLTRLLLVGYRQTGLVERLAGVSRRALHERQELRGELDRLTPVPELVAHGRAMRDVLGRLELVAPHQTTVLIRGETGTGKEGLARRLHQLSPRRDRPFVAVNCGALPDGLVESELFGHDKGAFTGASRRHRGRFERADRGTLFLDEVGDLPASAQVKLLRFLQEGTFERVGAERPTSADVRVVAATHQPLEELIAAGRFREDLYYRLSVFLLEVPPLRARREDIIGLATALLSDLARRHRRRPPSLPRAAIARLLAHSWPGNVRELANVLETSLILSPGDSLRLADLAPAPAAVSEQPVRPLDDSIRAAIQAALAATDGRIYGAGGAAELLGLKPSTLQSKMRKLGVRRR